MIRQGFVIGAGVLVCLVFSPGPDLRSSPAPAIKSADAPPPGSKQSLEYLARTDPVGLLDACRGRFRAEVRGYRATLRKQERVAGTLYPPEEVTVAVREDPYAVLMIWRSGARRVLASPIEGTLFVTGENDGQVKVWRPAALFAQTMNANPTDCLARAASRYSITEAGLGHAVERTYRAWSAARDAGRLRVEFVGTRACPEVGGRVCHVLRRTCEPPTLDPFLMSEPAPESDARPADAAGTITLMIDAETGLQLGSELRRADGELVAAYFFRDVELNPAFPREQFTPAALRKK